MAPVGAIDRRKRLAHAHGPQRIGVGEGFTKKLRQRIVVVAFSFAQVLEKRRFVRQVTARIGDLGMRVTGAEVVNLQTLLLGNRAQIRQRSGHLPGDRNRLFADRRCGERHGSSGGFLKG